MFCAAPVPTLPTHRPASPSRPTLTSLQPASPPAIPPAHHLQICTNMELKMKAGAARCRPLTTRGIQIGNQGRKRMPRGPLQLRFTARRNPWKPKTSELEPKDDKFQRKRHKWASKKHRQTQFLQCTGHSKHVFWGDMCHE